MISGKVAVTAGELIVDPIAVWDGGKEQPVVPDLALGDETAALLSTGHRVERDAVTTPLHQAVETLAEHAHRGLDRTGDAGSAAVDQIAASSARTGFKAVAALLTEYGDALQRDDRVARVRTWADAAVVVVACLESNS
jgi:hypothetical protein